jgi:hypothetical protein
MSRHEISANNPAFKIIVGWDHPLQSFFAQVIERAKEHEDDKFALWIGTGAREIYEVEQLANRIRRFVDLSPEIRAKLYADKDEGR